ncbi:mucin-2-like [Gadus chalcogrammus]|uniref:mucin-2-like n=1 Tax=Gadus chalcogrammus TaxID=1042646 RepID=UPI0024C49F71|nr:mucin-2-like [Gadus chalcogrammus]
MSKRKAPRASNCWVSSLSNQTSKMEFLLNVAIWALLLVHVDSAGKEHSLVDHLNNMKVSSLHADEPPSSSSSSSSSSYNGSEPIAEAENTTVDTAVLHGSLDYLNSTTLNETSDLDPSTLIQPKAKENNTGNDTKIKLPEKLLPKALAEITSHHLSSSNTTLSNSTTNTTTAAAAATTNATAYTTPTSNPPNTEQTPSFTQTLSTPTTISHQPNPAPNTTTTPAPTPSHPSGPAALTSSTSGSSIPATEAPKDVPSTTQHGELSSARPKITAETSRAGTLASSTTTSSNSSTQTEAHANTPSPLSVEVTEKAVDPLVAGLVSAFIATAVVITLLLFLKLRRRDNRPQFHRLQDLPMDDMMEDTPLSMYSY